MTASTSAQYKRALEYVSKDFDETDPVRLAFVNIVRFLVENPTEKLRHLTFGMLSKAAQVSTEDGEILHRTIAYLTGSRTKLLLIRYEFIDADFEHELDDSEVDAFLSKGEFHDPRTGMPVSGSENSIYVFFRPNYSAFH